MRQGRPGAWEPEALGARRAAKDAKSGTRGAARCTGRSSHAARRATGVETRGGEAVSREQGQRIRAQGDGFGRPKADASKGGRFVASGGRRKAAAMDSGQPEASTSNEGALSSGRRQQEDPVQGRHGAATASRKTPSQGRPGVSHGVEEQQLLATRRRRAARSGGARGGAVGGGGGFGIRRAHGFDTMLE